VVNQAVFVVIRCGTSVNNFSEDYSQEALAEPDNGGWLCTGVNKTCVVELNRCHMRLSSSKW